MIVPNPKTSGNGRYTYLAAWGYALQKFGTDAAARDFVTKLFANVPVLDGGGRGATTTFTQRDIGDVLVTFENEAHRHRRGARHRQVRHRLSLAQHRGRAARRRGRDGGRQEGHAQGWPTAYLEFLFSPQGQEIIAKHAFRPRSEEVLHKYASRFPAIKTFSVEQTLGGWDKVQKDHFADGAIYDQIVVEALSVTVARARASTYRGLPGFGLSLGFTLAYLSLIVLVPLSARVPEDRDACPGTASGRRWHRRAWSRPTS